MTAADMEERDYVEECPSCGCRFIGLTPEEYRKTHAIEDCPNAPFVRLVCFPTNDEELDGEN